MKIDSIPKKWIAWYSFIEHEVKGIPIKLIIFREYSIYRIPHLEELISEKPISLRYIVLISFYFWFFTDMAMREMKIFRI